MLIIILIIILITIIILTWTQLAQTTVPACRGRRPVLKLGLASTRTSIIVIIITSIIMIISIISIISLIAPHLGRTRESLRRSDGELGSCRIEILPAARQGASPCSSSARSGAPPPVQGGVPAQDTFGSPTDTIAFCAARRDKHGRIPGKRERHGNDRGEGGIFHGPSWPVNGELWHLCGIML